MASEVHRGHEEGDAERDRQGGLQSGVVFGVRQRRPSPDGEGEEADRGLTRDEADRERGPVEATSPAREDDEHRSERERTGRRNQGEEQDAKGEVGRWGRDSSRCLATRRNRARLAASGSFRVVPVPLPSGTQVNLDRPDAAEARLIAGGVAGAVAARGALTSLQRVMIEALTESMTGFVVPVVAVPRIGPEEFAV